MQCLEEIFQHNHMFVLGEQVIEREIIEKITGTVQKSICGQGQMGRNLYRSNKIQTNTKIQ